MSSQVNFRLLLGSLALIAVAGLKVQLKTGEEECFTTSLEDERLQTAEAFGEALLITAGYFLSRSRSLEATVTGPDSLLVWAKRSLPQEGELEEILTRPRAGEYKICFKNRSQFQAVVDLAYFSITHGAREDEKPITAPVGAGRFGEEEVAQHVHLQEVHSGIVRMKETAEVMRGEARYMRKRIARHVKTAKSTNKRTIYWTLIEVAVLLVVAGMQIVIYQQMFKSSELKPVW
uniref:GOLD domain-containing protein n=1 Tax=Tetraselmis sp. GSL018 TaxID=582737 RepID=A0A061RUX1_9CHLO|mmetsp:Transcript_15990/g.37910  ORF Transcript_15990/g.37910 Transcript_15990/m.37910 type:complete len:233 (-) Transcript_15990:74-772(-)|eukprot:CAMPEP_0177610348 /NCGR_PEP_ID=MMETSP0419_2-20121207/19714_1 /TAXON_ID=582737 /ORGANISM="Tetraselmis sp., Strain GSL018" /LENGTH=232 /DNA_ID=CAMNT_0019105613 /DNA_START=114 /DNA_END=812 /DNA_ORIENTATION=-